MYPTYDIHPSAHTHLAYASCSAEGNPSPAHTVLRRPLVVARNITHERAGRPRVWRRVHWRPGAFAKYDHHPTDAVFPGGGLAVGDGSMWVPNSHVVSSEHQVPLVPANIPAQQALYTGTPSPCFCDTAGESRAAGSAAVSFPAAAAALVRPRSQKDSRRYRNG